MRSGIMADFFRNLVEDMKDEDTNIMGDGKGSAEYSGTVDSGSYMLNAVLSGSIFGGVPNNKITAFAGESATGKTFFVLGVVKQFLQDNPDGGIVYYDTEAAVTKQMMEERGVDTSRVIISEPDTIQKFRTHAMKTIDMYEKSPDRPPMMFILDSLGLLSTEKEVADTAEGKDVRDMTKSQLIKGAFRVLTLKLAKIGVPMIVTNHVYEVIGSYMPQKEMGGGSGGLDRYYGLLEFGEKHGIFKKSGNRYEMGESKLYGKQILKDPEKYFTEEVLKQIDEKVSQEFKYGTA